MSEDKVILHKTERAVSYDEKTKEICFHKFSFSLDELYQVVKIVEQKEKENVNG